MTFFQIVCGLAAIAAAAALCGWIGRVSKVLAVITAIGLGLRLAGSIVLFAISYFNVDLLTDLQSGGGFWKLALDAQIYYASAARAAAHNPFALAQNSASPGYLIALALWLRGTGISVLGAILFNAVCYLATIATIVAGPRAQRDDAVTRRLVVIIVTAFSLSPVLLLTGTQVLKDPFFTLVIVATCRTAIELFSRLSAAPGLKQAPVAFVALAMAGVGLAGGVRPYYAAILCAGFAAGFAVLIAGPVPTLTGRWKRAVLGAAALVVIWVAFMAGAGSEYTMYWTGLTQFGMAQQVQATRNAFVETGGATNMSRPRAETPPAPKSRLVASYSIFLIERMGNGASSTPVTEESAARAIARDGNKRVLFVAVDTGPVALESGVSRYPRLAAALANQGVAVHAVRVDLGQALPADALYVIAATTSPVLPASGREAVRALLNRGGRLLKVVEGAATADAVESARAVPRISDGLRKLTTGLLAIFVPMSVLKALSLVTVQASIPLIAITDVDTVFFDAILVLLAITIARSGSFGRPAWAAAAFTLSVVVVTTGLMAYVVTNFGTLFRLRLLIAAPAWVAPLAVNSGKRAEPSPPASAGSDPFDRPTT